MTIKFEKEMLECTKTENFAIEAYGLKKTFGSNKAVNGIDLKVPVGQICGVLGPNGAGKTTTMNMLATLLKPDEGNAKIFGYDLQKQPHIIRQLIGVTGQYASVDENLSAIENLVIFSRLLGLSKTQSRKKAEELLEEFSLIEAAHRPISKFSGGMRRRLDLAASLIVQPPLIFLDEPTTGLDPRTRNHMWNTIRRLVSRGTTILLTTQYLDEADQLADQIIVIDRGQVVAKGTVEELKSSVGIASLELRLINRADEEAANKIISKTLNINQQVLDNGLITAPMSNPDKATDLLIELRNAKIQLSEISVKKPTLDEVFLAITGHVATQSNGESNE